MKNIVKTRVSQRCVDLLRAIGHLLIIIGLLCCCSTDFTNEVLRFCYERSHKGYKMVNYGSTVIANIGDRQTSER